MSGLLQSSSLSLPDCLTGIFATHEDCPRNLRILFHRIQIAAMTKFSESRENRYTCINGFIFLRFFVPAVIVRSFSLCSNFEYLLIYSRILTNLACLKLLLLETAIVLAVMQSLTSCLISIGILSIVGRVLQKIANLSIYQPEQCHFHKCSLQPFSKFLFHPPISD